MANKNADMLGQLTSILDEYLVKKAPALPAKWKETIVKIAPVLVIIGVVLSIPAILALLGLNSFLGMMPYGAMAMAHLGTGYYLSMLILVVVVVMEAMAIPGLQARKMKGWQYLYYAALLQFVSSLIGGNVIGSIIGAVIELYFLFQVKSYYKN